MSERENEVDKDARMALFVAFACGVVAGAACGLLLAPAHGRETRRWVAEQGRAARQQVLERNRRLTDLVRREGVRGLVKRIRTGRIEDVAAGGVAPA